MTPNMTSQLVTWCFKPSEPQRIISGLTVEGDFNIHIYIWLLGTQTHTQRHTHTETHTDTQTHTQTHTNTHTHHAYGHGALIAGNFDH